MGVDVSPARIVEKTTTINANIVALSALLTTTIVKQREVIEALEKAGIRKSVIVMVGGAPVTREWIQTIRADGYSEDAIGAVRVAKQVLGL